MSKVMHFTIGPVQGFVAQARRTRDLWAGSFLLSYLSGIAMRSIIKSHNESRIVFPVVHDEQKQPTDPLLKAIFTPPMNVGEGPKIGTLPNRFKASFPDEWTIEECHKAARNAATAVRNKWYFIAEEIWNVYLNNIASNNGSTNLGSSSGATSEIWKRQIKNFWDINFVVGEEDGRDGGWLDIRKNWRVHQPSLEEGGDHCTLMGEW